MTKLIIIVFIAVWVFNAVIAVKASPTAMLLYLATTVLLFALLRKIWDA